MIKFEEILVKVNTLGTKIRNAEKRADIQASICFPGSKLIEAYGYAGATKKGDKNYYRFSYKVTY